MSSQNGGYVKPRTGYICRQKDSPLKPCAEPQACVYSQCRRETDRVIAEGEAARFEQQLETQREA